MRNLENTQISEKAKKIANNVIDGLLKKARKSLGHGVDCFMCSEVLENFAIEYEKDAANLTSKKELKLLARIRFQQSVAVFLQRYTDPTEEAIITE
jgi:hypothetical protein